VWVAELVALLVRCTVINRTDTGTPLLAGDNSSSSVDHDDPTRSSNQIALSPFMSSEASSRASQSGAHSRAVLSPDDLQAFLNRFVL
jgi:hypothetical protein